MTKFPNDIAAENGERDEKPDPSDDLDYADYQLQIRRDAAMGQEIEK